MSADERTPSGTRFFVGTIFIIIGGLYLLNSLNIMDFRIGQIIFSFPFFITIIGLIILINSRRKVFGMVLASVGAFWLLSKYLPGFNIDAGIVFPSLIILFGIYIIVKHRSGYHANTNRDETMQKDYLDDVAIFGGGTKIINSDNFKGGNITAIFGGSEIDLTNCKLAEGNNVIDVFTMFGGAEISVPREWNVILNITPIFGGFSNKTRKDPGIPIDNTKALIIKGVAIFGGGEIKSR